MYYFVRLAERKVMDMPAYQGVDNCESPMGTLFFNLSGNVKDDKLVKKQGDNDFISVMKEIAYDDRINLGEENPLNAMKEEHFKTNNNKLDELERNALNCGSGDKSELLKQQQDLKESKDALFESWFTINVTSDKYSLKSFKSKYTCKLCNDNFQYRSQLSKHINAHQNGFKCDSCPKVFSHKSGITTHVLSHVKKLSTCCYCNESFGVDEIMEHLPSHFEDDSFRCDVCQSEFSDETSLNTHMVVHSKIFKKDDIEMREDEDGSRDESIQNYSFGVKNFDNEIEDRHYCNHCNRSYVHLRDLKRHLNQKHKENRTVAKSKFRHECQICKRKFRFSTQLETHNAFHLN